MMLTVFSVAYAMGQGGAPAGVPGVGGLEILHVIVLHLGLSFHF